MPLDNSIKKVLVIGAGPIVIGQSCEFDYSGTQACKALKEEGCYVVLLNSNPATIMTDPQSADSVYIEPICPDILEKIINKERPDSLLPIMGGQTALNNALELYRKGILEKYNVKLIGLKPETIEKAEDRGKFKEEIRKIGLTVPKSYYVSNWMQVKPIPKKIGFPLVIRNSYSLGGQGGGVAYNFEELDNICRSAFLHSQELLIEESIIGWKEFELEVMRDLAGNCIVVCGIENIDPMGIHTGDSITVAPIQTLTDKEYQAMRKAAFSVMEGIGMTSGGCNVQFAIHPKTGKMHCIEINPRVSRSSALASKATGFPIAKIATKLALGYTLNELKNEKEAPFPSSFEPTLDYVVTKIPRFNFDKFPDANQQLTTQMKSIGEVMAIGSTFKESLQKAIASLDLSSVEQEFLNSPGKLKKIRNELTKATSYRLWYIFEAIRRELPLKEIQELTAYDSWFLLQIKELIDEEKSISNYSINDLHLSALRRAKKRGFSDWSLARILKCRESKVLEKRKMWRIHPVYKRIDTCSAEFPTELPFLYSTYEEECESKSSLKEKILVIGSGPNRIGQGIEFDYCCVHAIKAIKKLGYESIMVNCNPETVSTDYDCADKLYLEPLTIEHLLEIIRIEQPKGILVQFGGQTPLNLGKKLFRLGIPILGTSFESIDIAEDRQKFRTFAKNHGIEQPKNCVFFSEEEAFSLCKEIGFPLVLRPSYVIGGSSIQIIQNKEQLIKYFYENSISMIGPILMEEFLNNCLEIEVDAICDGKQVFICGIVENLDPAGIHSGDSHAFLSSYLLKKNLQKEIEYQVQKIGLLLEIKGLFNIQFVIKQEEILVIEVNPRASRTIPLLAKTTGFPLVQIAVECILGYPLESKNLGKRAQPKYLGLKIPVFPFSRLHIEEKLGSQMKSTGEVLCLGKTVEEVFAKAKIYYKHQQEIFSKNLKQYFPCCSSLSEHVKVYKVENQKN